MPRVRTSTRADESPGSELSRGHRTPGGPRTSGGLGRTRAWLTAGCVGALLGAVAVVADNLPLGAGRVLLVLASTGLSWGAAAVVLGAWTHRARAAPVSGALALLAAVISYYVVIELAGTRPGAGTSDLVREGAIWAAAAVVGGPVAGVAGWFARNGGRRARPLAWGGLGGLLASQGVYLAASTVRYRSELTAWNVGLPLVLVVVPAAAVVIGTRRGRPVLALVALLAVAVLGAAGWFVLDEVVHSAYR